MQMINRILRYTLSSVLLFTLATSLLWAAGVTYTYDKLGRITRAVYDNGPGIEFHYDANGNRIQRIVDLNPLLITTRDLPIVTVGDAANLSLQASGGTLPYTWSLSAGTLPAGLSLDSAGGVIVGTPTEEGAFTITLSLIDANNKTTTRNLVLISIPSQP